MVISRVKESMVVLVGYRVSVCVRVSLLFLFFFHLFIYRHVHAKFCDWESSSFGLGSKDTDKDILYIW